jgi:hypothetical protein
MRNHKILQLAVENLPFPRNRIIQNSDRHKTTRDVVIDRIFGVAAAGDSQLQKAERFFYTFHISLIFLFLTPHKFTTVCTQTTMTMSQVSQTPLRPYSQAMILIVTLIFTGVHSSERPLHLMSAIAPSASTKAAVIDASIITSPPSLDSQSSRPFPNSTQHHSISSKQSLNNDLIFDPLANIISSSSSSFPSVASGSDDSAFVSVKGIASVVMERFIDHHNFYMTVEDEISGQKVLVDLNNSKTRPAGLLTGDYVHIRVRDLEDGSQVSSDSGCGAGHTGGVMTDSELSGPENLESKTSAIASPRPQPPKMMQLVAVEEVKKRKVKFSVNIIYSIVQLK